MNIPVPISFPQGLPEPWNAAVIETLFPIRPDSPIKHFLAKLFFSAGRAGHPALYINTNFLHQDERWKVISAHGADWKPVTGVGVFPDDPPRLMTAADFYSFEFKKKMRSMLDPLMALAPADLPAAAEAYEQLAGYGNTTLVLSSLAAVDLGRRFTAATLPLVKDDTFRTFELYLPLYNRRNLSMFTPLPEMSLYFRECPEEGTLLLVSSSALQPQLEAAGLVFDSAGGATLPVEFVAP